MNTLLGFKQFCQINEGGNVHVTDKHGKEHAAVKLDLEAVSRADIRKSFIEFFKKLNAMFKKETGEPIWKAESILDSGHVFNGSSEAFFNKDITDDEYKAVKKMVGDIDVTVPNVLKKPMWEFLNKIQGKAITKEVSFVGHNKPNFSDKNAQINALLLYKSGKTSLNLQVDFEFLPYDANDAPNEFAKFSHSSHWEDLKAGLKGVHHKYLLRALAGGASLRRDVQVITKARGKPQANPDGVTFNKFSVDKGLRIGAYTPALDDAGEHKVVNGLPAYYEVSTDDSTYTTDVSDIGRNIFGDKVKPAELKKGMGSFLGLIDLMKKYMDKEQITATLDRMVDLYWAKGSQGFERNDPELDLQIKTTGWAVLTKAFPSYKRNLDAMLKAYYLNYRMTEIGV